MKDCAVSTKRCCHIDFGRKRIVGAGRVYWELEMSVHLCSDFGFKNEGDIVVIGMDVPVWSVKY